MAKPGYFASRCKRRGSPRRRKIAGRRAIARTARLWADRPLRRPWAPLSPTSKDDHDDEWRRQVKTPGPYLIPRRSSSPFHETVDVIGMKLLHQGRPEGVDAAPAQIFVEVFAHR